MRMSRESAEKLLEKLNNRMEEDAEVLHMWFPDVNAHELRWQWEVDEEDQAMEVLYGFDPKRPNERTRPKTIYDVLGGWAARECYPKEFVIALLTGELP